VAPIRFLLKGIPVRKAEIDTVDFARKIVTVLQGVQRRPTKIAHDHLVVALGQGSDLTRTRGLTDHGLTMKTLEDARRLRAHVLERLERLEHADITGLPEVKQGARASLGARRGVADVRRLRLTGFPDWPLWRAYYVVFLPGIATKVRVLASWLLDAVTPRPLVVIRTDQRPSTRHVHYRAGDRIHETGTRADGLFTLIEGAR
jgi:NADH dehydrogenase FAD-containing subunit